ncbi:MAG: AIM24 family protein [Bacteroidia bacterium]
MSKFSIQSFLQETAEKASQNGFFELEKPQLLELNLNNQSIWAKAGSMVAYLGNIKFERQGLMSQGLGNLFKKAFSGEGTTLMKCEGTGKLYLADAGKKIRVLYLENEGICVNGNDVLAYEAGIQSEIKMLKSIAGMLSGGLFQVKLTGKGHIAITTHGDPLTLVVTPDNPIYTDPNATVAWSANLTPDIKTDISFKTLIGRDSGESIQMKFSGSGWVLVQPYEEIYLAQR